MPQARIRLFAKQPNIRVAPLPQCCSSWRTNRSSQSLVSGSRGLPPSVELLQAAVSVLSGRSFQSLRYPVQLRWGSDVIVSINDRIFNEPFRRVTNLSVQSIDRRSRDWPALTRIRSLQPGDIARTSGARPGHAAVVAGQAIPAFLLDGFSPSSAGTNEGDHPL